ncbi:MAG: acyltransferase [Halobacteriovoraceae bacterium]|nr:acyltransferase [Halobacteriovoraceae bacterium]
MKYRPDIDGLRAIAVLSVVFYHLDYHLFSGGYVGVDVFFVISGYLICSIILKRLEQNKFTIRDFYIRRIKRIFPALFFVLTVTSVLSTVVLAPQPYLKQFAQSLISTVLFGSNILFWKQSGYFDTQTELKPLLHTWSLGVEEQYYIFFPLLLMFLFKYRRQSIKFILLLTFVVSFVLNIMMTTKSPTTAFYLLPFRAWEIMLGAFVSVGLYPQLKKPLFNNLLSLSGLSLIASSVVLYTEQTLFPGFYALAPTVGTYFIISSGMDKNNLSLVNKFLQWKPFVVIGLLSYSLYLWHWPFIAFKKYLSFIPFSQSTAQIVVIALFTFFTVISYHFVEKPFRQNLSKQTIKYLVSGSLAFSLSFLCVGFYLNSIDGEIWKKFSLSSNEGYIEIPKPDEYLPGYDVKVEDIKEDPKFLLGDVTTSPQSIVIGDSHAQALAMGMDKVAKKLSKSFYFFSDGGLIPLLNIRQERPNKRHHIDFNKALYNIISKDASLKNVILIARWMAYYDPLSTKDHWQYLLYREGEKDLSYPKNKIILKEQMEKTLKYLQGLNKNVFIFVDMPTHNPAIVQMVDFNNRFSQFTDASPNLLAELYHLDVESQQELVEPFVELLKEFQKKYPFKIIHYDRALIENGRYIYFREGKLMYKDDDHLNDFGSTYLANKNIDLIKDFL